MNEFALSLGAGNTTALDIAWRVTNLPFGIFSVAVITVLYPLISRQAAGEDIKGIKESFSLGVREMGYIMLPAIFLHYNVGNNLARSIAAII